LTRQGFGHMTWAFDQCARKVLDKARDDPHRYARPVFSMQPRRSSRRGYCGRGDPRDRAPGSRALRGAPLSLGEQAAALGGGFQAARGAHARHPHAKPRAGRTPGETLGQSDRRFFVMRSPNPNTDVARVPHGARAPGAPPLSIRQVFPRALESSASASSATCSPARRVAARGDSRRASAFIAAIADVDGQEDFLGGSVFTSRPGARTAARGAEADGARHLQVSD